MPGVLKSELEDLEMLDLNFPKDRQGGDSIRDSWVADMSHFCSNFTPPKGKFETEQFVLYKVNDDRYVQGFIDLIRKNADGTIRIDDTMCTGCGLCETLCKFNAIELLKAGDK